MKIRRVKAADFGKLNGSLELADGMTVVHGANEAGKTSWLQATFAGLCGRRRGKGAPRRRPPSPSAFSRGTAGRGAPAPSSHSTTAPRSSSTTT